MEGERGVRVRTVKAQKGKSGKENYFVWSVVGGR